MLGRKRAAAFLTTLLLVLVSAFLMGTRPFGTSGQWVCTRGTCIVGDVAAPAIQLLTDGASLDLDVVANEFTFRAATTGTAVLMGADAAGAANTTLDTSGAGAIVIGSADVTTVTVTTDAGSVVLDGSVTGQVAVLSQTAGAITMNTVTLATAAGDYTIADDVCAVTADIGNWFTLVLEDDSVVVVINPLDAVDTLFIPGVDIAAGDEADSISTAAYEGAHITMVCMAINEWYATSTTTEADGTTFWADGGSS